MITAVSIELEIYRTTEISSARASTSNIHAISTFLAIELLNFLSLFVLGRLRVLKLTQQLHARKNEFISTESNSWCFQPRRVSNVVRLEDRPGVFL